MNQTFFAPTRLALFGALLLTLPAHATPKSAGYCGFSKGFLSQRPKPTSAAPAQPSAAAAAQPASAGKEPGFGDMRKGFLSRGLPPARPTAPSNTQGRTRDLEIAAIVGALFQLPVEQPPAKHTAHTGARTFARPTTLAAISYPNAFPLYHEENRGNNCAPHRPAGLTYREVFNPATQALVLEDGVKFSQQNPQPRPTKKRPGSIATPSSVIPACDAHAIAMPAAPSSRASRAQSLALAAFAGAPAVEQPCIPEEDEVARPRNLQRSATVTHNLSGTAAAQNRPPVIRFCPSPDPEDAAEGHLDSTYRVTVKTALTDRNPQGSGNLADGLTQPLQPTSDALTIALTTPMPAPTDPTPSDASTERGTYAEAEALCRLLINGPAAQNPPPCDPAS